jgi:indolepyruvate ferredoxin oxidoreductase
MDLSCLAGDCPSFLAVEPGQPGSLRSEYIEPPAEPAVRPQGPEFTMRIAGVGGTGVVTLSQVLATAALLEGLCARTLDQTGLAQKGGPVVSDLVFSARLEARSPRLAIGECDLYLGCDAVVATDRDTRAVVGTERTAVVVSTARVPTGEMILDPHIQHPDSTTVRQAFADVCLLHTLDPVAIARREIGEDQFANVLMLGAAYQTGALPISAGAIERALELNEVAVPANIRAFRVGRRAIADRGIPRSARNEETEPPDLDAVIERRRTDLVGYQDVRYAERYVSFVETVRRREREVTASTDLSLAVARNLYKLMAYKDEYEVARLSVDPRVMADVVAQFGPAARAWNLFHPPALRALGLNRKLELGRLSRPLLHLLIRARRLRGTAFDPFGPAHVRRVERQLILDYRAAILDELAELSPDRYPVAVRIAALPDVIRGYEDVKLASVQKYRTELAALRQQQPSQPQRPGMRQAVAHASLRR